MALLTPSSPFPLKSKTLDLQGFMVSFRWWRRGESNPRPNTNHADIYVCSFRFNFAWSCPETGHSFARHLLKFGSRPGVPALNLALLSSLRSA